MKKIFFHTLIILTKKKIEPKNIELNFALESFF